MNTRTWLTIAVLLGAMVSLAEAQSPVPMVDEPYELDFGTQDNDTMEFKILPPKIVSRPGAAWMRVALQDTKLGERSFIVLTSVQDGQEQILDTPTLAVWSFMSGEFMGESVQIELHVAPAETGIHVHVSGLTLPLVEAGGEPAGPSPDTTLCGSDDRVADNNPKVGRLPASGCTGWLVSNGAALTAGHCGVAVGDVLEFNVPASSANGNTNPPPLSDQFPVTAISAIQNLGVGQDYQVLALGPCSATGVRAHATRGFYRMVQTTPSNGTTIRVTGCGLDWTPAGTGGAGAYCCDPDGNGPLPCAFNCNSTNQTEQTATGSYAGLSGGNTHSYAVDTTPANSGSPIIWDAFDVTIGIHTAGGCTSTGGNNVGTAFVAAPLKNALQSFPGANAKFVDVGISGLPQNGGVYEPYVTMAQGVAGVSAGGILSVVTGYYPAAAGGTFVINKAMTIVAPVGVVTIAN